jgi:Cyclic nucleotide-binding domain
VWARLHAIARERSAGRPAAEAPEATTSDDTGEDPRWRLRLAQAFLRAGQKDEARRTLLSLADELVRRGQSEMAVALLQKVERAAAPAPVAPRPTPPPAAEGKQRRPVVTDDKLGLWVTAVSRTGGRAVAGRAEGPREGRESVETLAALEASEAYPGLRACPLFDGLGDEDLRDCLRGLPLEVRAPGEILLTEGEPSDSLLVIARGRVKVFVRQRSGRDGLLAELGQGAFLGEIGVLAGLPRSATAVTSTRCLLLRVDRRSLETLCRRHPPARAVLEVALEARATNQDESPIRERTDND